jgi:hypothetical protein
LLEIDDYFKETAILSVASSEMMSVTAMEQGVGGRIKANFEAAKLSVTAMEQGAGGRIKPPLRLPKKRVKPPLSLLSPLDIPLPVVRIYTT